MNKTPALLILSTALLAGCATTAERSPIIPVAAISDQHATFERMRVTRSGDGLFLAGGLHGSAGSHAGLYRHGSIEIEFVADGQAHTVVDVPWQPLRSGRALRPLPRRIAVKLPLHASEATLIRVSHGHSAVSSAAGAQR